jgi:hypothetical protein
MTRVVAGATLGAALLGGAVFHLWPLVHEGVASTCDAALAAEMSHPETVAEMQRMFKDYETAWMTEVMRFRLDSERYQNALRRGSYAIPPYPLLEYYARTPQQFIDNYKREWAIDSRESYAKRYTYLPIATRCALAWWQIRFYI